MTVTPEAAGSSPVDPANILQVSYLRCSGDSSTSGGTAGGLKLEASRRREHLDIPKCFRLFSTLTFQSSITESSGNRLFLATGLATGG
jgi:hypothetical protein